jgi:thiol-disulfide isomerase/thioredoxin
MQKPFGRWFFALAALAVTWDGLLVSAEQTPEPKVAVRTVKYDGLLETLNNLKGKVVIVDFWADFCIPCKKEFPRLVELDRKYGKDGLAAVSVSLDDLTQEGAKERVIKFLESQKATFTNLILDEKPEFWQEKLRIVGVPAVYVIGRDGKLVERYIEEANYTEIEKVAVQQLKQKKD